LLCFHPQSSGKISQKTTFIKLSEYYGQ
jgi:hypothetical protein